MLFFSVASFLTSLPNLGDSTVRAFLMMTGLVFEIEAGEELLFEISNGRIKLCFKKSPCCWIVFSRLRTTPFLLMLGNLEE